MNLVKVRRLGWNKEKNNRDKEFGLLEFDIKKVSIIFFLISIVTGYKYSHQRIPEVLGNVIL